ncbi:MAG: hypothetical protein F6K47_04355 [Symploca sp. SIO2E6]|nr:hypothetical protein [Symploca sp. SIO2E6]
MASSNDSFIMHVKENGIEYFTVTATGKSGISEIGIARTLGIYPSAVSLWHKKLSPQASGKDIPRSLEPLIGKNSNLYAQYYPKIYTSDFWACLAEYYAFESKRTTTEAIRAFRSFARIGAESFIQDKTGWIPEQCQSSIKVRSLIDCFLNNPQQARSLILADLFVLRNFD